MLTDEAKKQIEAEIKAAKGDRTKEYEQFKRDLQQALYYFTGDNPFIGGLLQELNFKPVYTIPTAALAYDKHRQTFEVIINPLFFNKFKLEERVAILHHEVLHFVNNHIFRMSMDKCTPEEVKRKNIAADMAINQYISHLPFGCIDVKHYKDKTKTPFPKFQTAEVYEKLLEDNPDAHKDARGEMEKEAKEKGLELGEGDGQLDEHPWDGLSEDEKKAYGEEVKKLLKRTMEKTSYDKSSLPDSIKEFLEEIEVFLQKMNYKKILMDTIKKTVCFADREGTWKRPNKRYGNVAPGTTLSKLPQLNIYIDTSGSISVIEMNQFLAVLNGFLKAGTRKCNLGFWHTALYKKRKYKLNQKVSQNEIESGGTDMTQVCEDINENKPDLAIILTDGYYDTKVTPQTETIVIISEKGGMDHPLKGKVKTICMKGLI